MKSITLFIGLLLVCQTLTFQHYKQNKLLKVKAVQDDSIVVDDPVLQDCNPETDYTLQVANLYDRLQGYQGDLQDNEDELGDLNQARCTANMLFVESLKEHRLALQIIESLTSMVTDFESSGDTFVQQRQYEKLQTALLAVQSGSDIQSVEMVDQIYDKMNLLQVEIENKGKSANSRIYDIMHSESENLNKFTSMTEQLKSSPKNLKAILAHLGTKIYQEASNVVEEEIISYQDLDFDSFDTEEMEDLATFEYTPVDIQQLRGDLLGLLNALITHLDESQEDLIQRELAASVTFADWRYDMEEENYELQQGIDNLLQEAQDVAHCMN